MSTLDLAGLLLALGYTDGEQVQLCRKARGGPFVPAVVGLHGVRDLELRQDCDMWFGVNPCRAVAEGRPAAADVTRLAAIWVDLDVKERGCPNFEVAQQILDDLSGMLGDRTVAVTYSGHGLQGMWAVDRAPISEAQPGEGAILRSDARALLRRWGRLVAAVAERRGAAVDSVFDLPRILRCPGTVNHKGDPIPVVTLDTGGAPVSVERILETLDEWGVPDRPEDHADPGAMVSAPAEWAWRGEGDVECGYVAKMVQGWGRDDPTDRHPWLVAQAVRIAVLHRHGCLTEQVARGAAERLVQRFVQLLGRSGTQREPDPGEIYDAFAWGRQRAAAMLDDQVRAELGHHSHAPPPIPLARLVSSRHLSLVPQQIDGSLALAAEPAQGTPPATGEGEGLTTGRHTDDGNAQALIDAHGERVRYCAERGRWLTWDGARWYFQPSGGGDVRELSKDVARRLPDDKHTKIWRNRSLSALGTSSTLAMACTDPRVTVDLADLDADPWALNTPGGVVDLRTGVIAPPRPAALHTRITAAVPDEAADAGGWLRFLDVTFAGDAELIGYLQRLVGYSATGHIGPHVLPFAHGNGGNGKGVFLEAIARVLGDYATSAPNAFLMSRQYGQHETEIARLAGARMVLCSEVNETDRFDEAKVKQLTGGDTLTARFMRQDHFTFTPTHHLWLMGNHKPAVTSGGRSFWRRCRLIPFRHEVPDSERVDDLQGILARDHGGAILAWIVQGARDYYQGGLREPESVIRATEEYAHDQDTVGRFVEECCHLAPGTDALKVQMRTLYSAYERWCAENGEHAVTAKRLGSDLRARFDVADTRSHGRRLYVGLGLLVRSEDDDDED